MVKLAGHRHVQAMRAYVQRKLALQKRQLVKEQEAARRQSSPVRELPEYDPDDNGRFAGYDAIFRCEGDNYEALYRVLKKILRPAHYRTWAAANSDPGNGPPPCLSAKEIAERVGRHRRTIEIDLQEMRESRLLHIQPARRDGRWVMEMHYDVLYRLVHEYLEWERSADYVPAERQYFERIELDPNLKQHLLQFEDYRKVLVKKKPGPKSKKKSICHETYTCHQQAYLNDHQQKNTRSDAPILPAASQGGMSKSVNLESPVPPALPRAGVSGDTHPEIPVEQNVSQEFVSGSDHQEVPAMLNTHQSRQNNMNSDFDLEDGTLIFNAVLPTNILDIRRRRNMAAPVDQPEVRNISHLIDENDVLHVPASVIPKLRDLLLCVEEDRWHFHHRLAFTPEIQNLFDDPAVAVWTYFFHETGEILFRMEYGRAYDRFDFYKRFQAKTLANIKAMYENENEEPDTTAPAPAPEKQEAADNTFPRMKNPVNLREIWTPELEDYILHGDPNVRYFVPRSDFPPEKQADFPDDSVGVLFCRKPDTNSLTMCQCSDPFMEGIKAQLEPSAQAEAGQRHFLQTLYPRMQLDGKNLAPEAEMVSTHREQDEEKSHGLVNHFYESEAQGLADDSNAEKSVISVGETAIPKVPCEKRTERPGTESVSRPTVQEVVHGGDRGAVYPAILPLLRDFMQQKLLGGDTEMRYFMTYEKLASPGIEQAFPEGTDGIWIWKQEPGPIIHVKPTCIALDPALKKRNLSGLSVAVGRLSDDDGTLYSSNRNPHFEGAPVPGHGRPSNSYDKSPGAEPAPVFSGNRSGKRRTGNIGKPHAVSPPGQQAQEKYQSLLTRARDGKGKGLQRIF